MFEIAFALLAAVALAAMLKLIESCCALIVAKVAKRRF